MTGRKPACQLIKLAAALQPPQLRQPVYDPAAQLDLGQREVTAESGKLGPVGAPQWSYPSSMRWSRASDAALG